MLVPSLRVVTLPQQSVDRARVQSGPESELSAFVIQAGKYAALGLFDTNRLRRCWVAAATVANRLGSLPRPAILVISKISPGGPVAVNQAAIGRCRQGRDVFGPY